MGIIRSFSAGSLAAFLLAATASAASAGFWDIFRRDDPEPAPPPPAAAIAPVQAPHPLTPPAVGTQAAPVATPGYPMEAIPLAPVGQVGLPATTAPAGMVPLSAQETGDVHARMDRIEDQIRALTGQLEQLTFELQTLHTQLAQSGVAGIQPLTAEGGAPMDAGGGFHADAAAPMQTLAVTPAPVAPASLGSAIEGQPPAMLGTVPASAPGLTSQGPMDVAALAAGGRTAVSIPPANALPSAQAIQLAALPPGDSRAAYDGAYQSILNGDYATAEQGFRTFLAAYPSDGRAPDAQYWLGESYYARGLYREAADAFLTGYNSFPESAKGADTLLKLGLSLAGLGEQSAACGTFAETLRRYPSASAALVQRVRAEQASGGC